MQNIGPGNVSTSGHLLVCGYLLGLDTGLGVGGVEFHLLLRR